MILLTISNVFAFSDSAQVINFILNALAAQFHVLHCNALVLNWFVTCQLTYYLSWLAGVAYLVAFPEFSVCFLHFPFLTIVVLSCLENRSVHTSQLRQHYISLFLSCLYSSSINSKKVVYKVLQLIQKKLFTLFFN